MSDGYMWFAFGFGIASAAWWLVTHYRECARRGNDNMRRHINDLERLS